MVDVVACSGIRLLVRLLGCLVRLSNYQAALIRSGLLERIESPLVALTDDNDRNRDVGAVLASFLACFLGHRELLVRNLLILSVRYTGTVDYDF